MSIQTVFKTYLRESSKKLEKELKKISKELNKENTVDLVELKKLQARFTKSWLGGKMFRGTLVKLGYDLGHGEETKEIFKPAAAFEILHTALLIHDDIIDRSPIRRGKPAMHLHKNSHYGISQAICLGDLGISLSGKLIAESTFSQEKKNLALAYFFEIVNQTILGEMLDVSSSQTFKRTQKQILQIHKMKTAHYTLVGPLTLGAMLAGADKELLNKIKLFAEPLGIAFQIQDDILGIFGDEKIIGKSTSSDIEENKNTLLISYALKYGTKLQRAVLAKYYGKKGITQKEKETVKKIFVETGALYYSESKISKLTQESKKTILQMKINEEKKELLKGLTEVLIARAK